MNEETLRINEIFYSIQGESTWAGLPCTFVRLQGCPLRCHYCDSSYAFRSGEQMLLSEIIRRVDSFNTSLVELTGGEPLAQHRVHILIDKLLEKGYTILLETSGERELSTCDPRIYRVIDIKTPSSGAPHSFLEENYEQLSVRDELKFVILNYSDFEWAVQLVTHKSLFKKVKDIHLSPVMYQDANEEIEGCSALDPEQLASWILECGLPFRMQLQLHKYIWSPLARGV